MFPFHFNPSRWLAADDPGWASSRRSSGSDSRASVGLHLLGCCEASLPLGGSRTFDEPRLEEGGDANTFTIRY